MPVRLAHQRTRQPEPEAKRGDCCPPRESTWVTYLASLVVDHDVVGLDVSMNNALGVAVVQGTQQLVEVVLDVRDAKARVENLHT